MSKLLMTKFRAESKARRPTQWEDARLRLEDDEALLERLRALGVRRLKSMEGGSP